MYDLSTTIAIGVISGLVTTFLVVVFQQFWARILIPWFEELVYKDVKIEGSWHSEYGDQQCGKEAIKVNRKGHRVTGAMTTVEGQDQGNVYRFEGVFKNLILTASYSSENQSSLDRGTISLMLTNNGNQLEGHSSFYEDGSHKITSLQCTWYRDQ